MKHTLALMTGLLLLAVGTIAAEAALLTFSFTDPTGDFTGSIDAAGLDFVFDDTTGAYSIDIFATAANPFDNSFQMNINLFNPDTGTTAWDPSYFQGGSGDITLGSSTTIHTINGVNSRLLSWDIGDRVAIGAGAFGNPDGLSGFQSGVNDLPRLVIPDFDRDLIGTSSNQSGGGLTTQFAIISAVPEPSRALLSLLGLGAVCLRRRR